MDKQFKDKPCLQCGTIMKHVSIQRKYCDECAHKRKLECQRKMYAERIEKRRAERKHDAKREKHPCIGCGYYRGSSLCVMTCNFFLDTGVVRGCPPGKDCIRRASNIKTIKEN